MDYLEYTFNYSKNENILFANYSWIYYICKVIKSKTL